MGRCSLHSSLEKVTHYVFETKIKEREEKSLKKRPDKK